MNYNDDFVLEMDLAYQKAVGLLTTAHKYLDPASTWKISSNARTHLVRKNLCAAAYGLVEYEKRGAHLLRNVADITDEDDLRYQRELLDFLMKLCGIRERLIDLAHSIPAETRDPAHDEAVEALRRKVMGE